MHAALCFRLLLANLLLLCPLASQVASAQHSQPRLTISTAHGQTAFHIGERIPLLLSFTGPDDKSFAIDMANYDRSGRMMEDSFSVEPETGWEDPLRIYFSYGAGMGGGMRSGATLSSQPIVRTANLNEWVRFDQLGTYTLTVTSHRVGQSPPAGRPSAGMPMKYADLVSENKLVLTIIPATPEWQQQTLKRITTHLPPLGKTGTTIADPPQEQIDAQDDLRFLASPAAADLLASRLRDGAPASFVAFFGLLSLPPAQTENGLNAMHALIESSTFPVSQAFLEAAAWLHMEQLPEWQAHHSPASSAEFAAFTAQKRTCFDKEWQRAAQTLLHKTGSAQTLTESTLLETAPAKLSPESTAPLGALVRQSFRRLSPAEQERALSQAWDIFGSRELLPDLRAIASGPLAQHDNSHLFFEPSTLPAIALKRWHELEPESAEVEAIRQIGKEYPTLTAKDVDFLGSQTFPQFEPLWAKTLGEGDEFTSYEPAASLLVRFGTGAVSMQMAAILRRPKDHLGNRILPATAYLIKFDPAAAHAILALQPKLLDGFIDSIASDIGRSEFLTQAALQRLSSSDPTVLSDALTYLRHYGDETVRDPIDASFQRWYDRNSKYAGTEELSLPQDVRDQLQLGSDLGAVLLRNQGWIPDDALAKHVLDRSIGAQMRQGIQALLGKGLQVLVSERDFSHTEIGPFEAMNRDLFEAKIAQFPPGTRFVLEHAYGSDPRAQEALEASLPALFEKHGMHLSLPGEDEPSTAIAEPGK